MTQKTSLGKYIRGRLRGQLIRNHHLVGCDLITLLCISALNSDIFIYRCSISTVTWTKLILLVFLGGCAILLLNICCSSNCRCRCHLLLKKLIVFSIECSRVDMRLLLLFERSCTIVFQLWLALLRQFLMLSLASHRHKSCTGPHVWYSFANHWWLSRLVRRWLMKTFWCGSLLNF